MAATAAEAEKTIYKGQAWFCTTGLPSDVIVEVDDMTFHLHKFPLMSKSRKLHNLISVQEANPSAFSSIRDQNPCSATDEQVDDEGDGGDEIEEVHCHIAVNEFPGGSETFELAAKFCYGVKIDLTASNVAPLRCAGEFLEMTEDYSEDNLISKTERFLSQSVLKNLEDSIRALKSCEKLMPLAETLGLAQRCVDAVASSASSADPTLFGWPVSDRTAAVNSGRDSSKQILWNGIETGRRRKGLGKASNAESWLEVLAHLSLPFFKRLILAMRSRDLSSEMIESCLMLYAKKSIPGISRTNRKTSSSSSTVVSENEQRELLETVISNLPLEKTSFRSSTSTATRFFFGLLRTANILNVSESSKAGLEKKLGSQLEQATLDDLLVPSYSYLTETLYDVDCVERILAYFLDGLEERDSIVIEDDDGGGGGGGNGFRSPSLMLVGKLIDGYLSEIASDANLKPEKFCNLAMSLPDQARLFHDGLYRAVDVYLKAHPSISESDREKICGVLDCQKLTLEACTHAAQNERLPLRAVVQVLFFEQLQLRHAIAENLITVEASQTDAGRPSVLRRERADEEDEDEAEDVDDDDEDGGEVENQNRLGSSAAEGNTWRAAVRENQVLRLDMDSMKTRVHQLERECSTMREVIEKIDKQVPPSTGNAGDGCGGSGIGWKRSLTKRFGCKFKTQVCDSHEASVVDKNNKGRRRNQHHHHNYHHHHQQHDHRQQ